MKTFSKRIPHDIENSVIGFKQLQKIWESLLFFLINLDSQIWQCSTHIIPHIGQHTTNIYLNRVYFRKDLEFVWLGGIGSYHRANLITIKFICSRVFKKRVLFDSFIVQSLIKRYFTLNGRFYSQATMKTNMNKIWKYRSLIDSHSIWETSTNEAPFEKSISLAHYKLHWHKISFIVNNKGFFFFTTVIANIKRTLSWKTFK